MRIVTQIGMILACIILIAVEIYALATPANQDTISEILTETFDKYPILLFLCGVITGHIVWPLTYKVQEFIRKEREAKPSSED